MSDLKAQEFYQLYRKKTIEAGYTPIGRQRFTGIIKTLSLIPETLNYLQNKANGQPNNHKQALPIRDVVVSEERAECEHKYDYYTNDNGETVAVCEKCMRAYF